MSGDVSRGRPERSESDEVGASHHSSNDVVDDEIEEDEGDFPGGVYDPRCPFCGTRSMDECQHLVASGSTGADIWGVDPFDGAPIPTVWDYLPDADEDIGWTDEQVAEAFGELAPVLEAYSQYGPCYVPNPPRLFDALRPFLRAEIDEKSHLDFVVGEFEAEFCYFAPDPGAVRSELASLLNRIREAFVHLATVPPNTGERA